MSIKGQLKSLGAAKSFLNEYLSARTLTRPSDMEGPGQKLQS